MCFIHSRLFRLCFALRRDIVGHRNIQLLSFFNRSRCQFLMNVYSDDLHTAVNFLSREALNKVSEPTTTLGVAGLKGFAVLASQSQEVAPLDCRTIEGGSPSV